MIILLDEPCLLVYPSAEAAAHDIEALDIEADLRAAFDETGVPYRVEWIRPNQRGWLRVSNGEYRLVPAGPVVRDSLLALLDAYQSVRNGFGNSVDVADLMRSARAG